MGFHHNIEIDLYSFEFIQALIHQSPNYQINHLLIKRIPNYALIFDYYLLMNQPCPFKKDLVPQI